MSELPAPTGFVHGYDLTHLLLQAAKEVADHPQWAAGTIQEQRSLLREALENIQQPVNGILGQYLRPFEPFGPQSPDAHEALGINDLCLARFLADGRLADAQ